MASRGILYIVWNRSANSALEATLARSMASVQRLHPDLPIHIHEAPREAGLLYKAGMFDLSPFEETLFLDADTVVLDRLDFGFEAAARHGLACCLCEAPYARRYIHAVQGDLPEYNTGVLFFDRSQRTRELFTTWANLAPTTDSRLPYTGPGGTTKVMPSNDQCAFALALHQTHFNPYALPQNSNLRPAWQHMVFGPVKVWHDYAPVPPALEHFNKAMQPPRVLTFMKLAG
jgi:hypothetical protein